MEMMNHLRDVVVKLKSRIVEAIRNISHSTDLHIINNPQLQHEFNEAMFDFYDNELWRVVQGKFRKNNIHQWTESLSVYIHDICTEAYQELMKCHNESFKYYKQVMENRISNTLLSANTILTRMQILRGTKLPKKRDNAWLAKLNNQSTQVHKPKPQQEIIRIYDPGSFAPSRDQNNHPTTTIQPNINFNPKASRVPVKRTEEQLREQLDAHYANLQSQTETDKAVEILSNLLDKPFIKNEKAVYDIIDHIGNKQARDYRDDSELTFKYGGKSFDEWYKFYDTLWHDTNDPQPIKEDIVEITPAQPSSQPTQIQYPFRSKINAYNNIHGTAEHITNPQQDYKIEKQLYLPSFCINTGSWEMDFAFGRKTTTGFTVIYLVFINVNTRFVVFCETKDQTTESVQQCLLKLMGQFEVTHLRGDGQSSFASEEMDKFYIDNHISTYFSGSPFTYHNKLVDVAIKTIRNGCGTPDAFESPDILQQVVNYYNDTPHRSFSMFGLKPPPTPKEMMDNPGLELLYIQYMKYKADRINSLRRLAGYEFKKGDRVICHIDFAKTSLGFKKKRKVFEYPATVIESKNNNIVVELDTQLKTSKGRIIHIIELPAIYVKHI